MMNTRENRRAQFRRYADRRIAALLELHEILFYDSPGRFRDARLLNTINDDYQTDRVAVVQLQASDKGVVQIIAASDQWDNSDPGTVLSGAGLKRVIDTHSTFDGALTLSKFRSSATFENGEWQALWESDLGAPASALLSVPISTKEFPQSFLWLVVNVGSREWSSHDRDLSEEESTLLARVLELKMLG